ncbi:metalloendoproteinase 1-MMP-like [Punica granatum]|uniref:Metalloendoproteinase 1-MMP-like n=2 Tax=Punica granatum TaxID=22663 RepID=A0A6P8DLW9_PUNGR|nr:metalloendoproteinase 1-MMP-like [Punica granatum]PKI41559.1 hypothetical protein CRG98_038070 [Punica granatum]
MLPLSQQISSFFIFLSIILCLPYCFPARKVRDPEGKVKNIEIDSANLQRHSFSRLTHAGQGSRISGMSELKRYFHRFGYLPPQSGSNFTDEFDAELESAVATYQMRLGLQITRQLDPDTVLSLMSPRCGMKDKFPSSVHKKLFHVTRHYTFFQGMPRWERPQPVRLTYGFSPYHVIDKLSLDDVRAAFDRAFERWAQVIPVEFEESLDYETADVRIAFYLGDHGDGEPFDGVLGILGHSFSPEDGRLHLDGAEMWAVDFGTEPAPKAVDLESVATHEIGHILGLGHSSVKEAVMYPVLKPRTTKHDLALDDVEGVQTLYGSNPNYKLNSLSRQSETASNTAVSQWAMVPTELSVTISALVFALLGSSW